MKVLFFGSIADVTTYQEMKISGSENLQELKYNLEKQFPELKTIRYSFAVNKVIVHHNLALDDSDVVALLPPFSGG
jgi:sulfur-carrier protein